MTDLAKLKQLLFLAFRELPVQVVERLLEEVGIDTESWLQVEAQIKKVADRVADETAPTPPVRTIVRKISTHASPEFQAFIDKVDEACVRLEGLNLKPTLNALTVELTTKWGDSLGSLHPKRVGTAALRTGRVKRAGRNHQLGVNYEYYHKLGSNAGSTSPFETTALPEIRRSASDGLQKVGDMSSSEIHAEACTLRRKGFVSYPKDARLYSARLDELEEQEELI